MKFKARYAFAAVAICFSQPAMSADKAPNWANGIVCIEAVAAAGNPIFAGIRDFSDWLENNAISFYIAGITIEKGSHNAGPLGYNLQISAPQHAERIRNFAQKFDPQTPITTSIAAEPLALDGVNSRWARWFPSRASLGYAMADPLADFAKTLLAGVEGILYVETEKYFNLQVYVRPAELNSAHFNQLVKNKLAGLPGTLTIRSDISQSRRHQTLLERTTPSVLEAIRLYPDESVEIAIEFFPGEFGSIGETQAKMAQIPGVRLIDEHSFEYDLLQMKCGELFFATMPAHAIPEFIHYFSIKQVLLVPDDCREILSDQ
jgi:hypothetical protein